MATAPVAQQGHLRKELTYLDLTMASLGGIIGSGWLYGSLRAGALAGPGAIFSWIIGGIAVLLIGLTYAELGGALPQAGAMVRYPQYSHGTFVSFIMGWAALIAYASVPPIEAESVVQFANYYVPGLYVGSTLSTVGLIVAFVLMVLFLMLNYWSVKVFAKTNTIWTLIKFVIPAFTVILLLVTNFHSNNFSSYGGFAPYGTSGIMAAVPLGGIVFAYLGFRQALDLGGEAKNPQRDIPRSILTAILIGIVLYVGLQLSWVVAMPASALAKGWAGINFSSPFANLVGTIGFGWWAAILFADALWSPSGTGNVYTASTSRVMLALSRNGYFPKAFLKINPKSGVPVVALLATVILGLVFLLPFPSWAALVGVVSSATVFTYIAGPVSIAVFRKTMPNLTRPFHLKGMTVLAPLAFIIASLIIYWSGWATDSVVLMAILFGVVLYAYGVSSFAEDTKKFQGQHLKAGVWLIVYIIVMLLMTLWGSKNFGAPDPVIPYPWDVIVVAVLSIIFYYWAVASGWKTPEAEEADKGIHVGEE